MKEVNLNYFAFFKDKTKKSNEKVLTSVNSVEELYDELNEKYNFDFCKSNIKVAINDDFTNFSSVLNDGDKVVFIPPVAGG